MRHIVIYTLTALPPMTKRPTKIDRLREMGMLNPQPERVRAPWFEVAGFFDALGERMDRLPAPDHGVHGEPQEQEGLAA